MPTTEHPISPDNGANMLEIEATAENLAAVQSFVEARLTDTACPQKARMQIELAVEEIFINIASYAYAPDTGTATVLVSFPDDPPSVTVTFFDRGIPYDPLKKQDPDITLCAQERRIGGLGVFLTKKLMDDVSYEYRDGQNVLTLKKRF